MPEEKKDSFTFSDKIRNSKAAGPASFANRISSKIGSNGRPKKTLFERTKRDAPFFIAALVALLLLPFLYKYSGQVNEEPVIAPASEDTVFDPERYGFDTAVTDPDDQIAQLSARDPLSLIKGWGSDEDTSADVSYDYDRSGLGDDGSSSAYTSSPTTETTTNIYRRTAAPATRAAVRRSTTKIKEMGRAAMASAGGGLNVTPWGGSLKGAAKKVGADAPKTPPKPVSLQPLQAVGRPQRGYFGMGSGEQARRSAQALTKANAMQALRDAQYAPIKSGRIGGLGGAEARGGGGASNLPHSLQAGSLKPWWWDLMATRSQMEWEKRLNRKWDWIGWADKLAQNILGGLINCLLTGEDDGAMGEMFGASGEAAQEEGCKCNDKVFHSADELLQVNPNIQVVGKFDKWCKNEKGGGAMGCTWQSAKAAGGGFIKTRLDCLGWGFGRYGKKGLNKYADISSARGKGRAACADFDINKVYSIHLQGSASSWHAYHFVVARNNSPFGDGKRLCGFDSSRQYTKTTSTGAEDVVPAVSLDEAYRLLSQARTRLQQIETASKTQPAYKRNRQVATINGVEYSAYELKAEIEKMEHSLEQARRSGEVTVGNNFAKRSQQSGRVQGRYSYEDINADAGKAGDENNDVEINYHDCVIYLGSGQEFEWRKFKEETMLLLAQLQGSKANTFYELEHDPGYQTAYNAAKQAFGRLQLRYIRGVVTKQPLAVDGKVSKNNDKLPAMPMIYFDFDRSYIQRTKGRSAGQEKNVDKVFSRKERDPFDYILTTPCDFTDLAILGEKITNNSPVATLKIPSTTEFKAYDVTAVITYEGEGKNYQVTVPASEIEPVAGTAKKDGATQTQQYKIKDARKLLMQQYPELVENGKLKPGFDMSGSDGKVKANVAWQAVERASQRTAADEVPVEADKAEPAPAPVVEVQAGGSLANYSCDPSTFTGAPAKSLVFYNGGTESMSINEAYKNTPIYCRECQATAEKVLGNVVKENQAAVNTNKASIEKLKKSAVPVSDPQYAKLELANKKAEQAIATAQRILKQKETRGQWWLTTMDYLIVLDYMSKETNDNTVPVRSVCYLARSIAQISADPTTPQRQKLNNVFGTFAVYVGPDSYLFPMQTVNIDNRTCLDPRFTGVSASENCVQKQSGKSVPVEPTYHWGYYDHSYWDSGAGFNGIDDNYPAGFKGYQDTLAEHGIGNDGYYPLGAMKLNYSTLSAAVNLPSSRDPSYSGSAGNAAYNKWSGNAKDSTTGTQQRRNDYHNAYNTPFYNTNGCDVYADGLRMGVSDVLQYLNLLCRNGLNFKPQTGYDKTDVDRRRYGNDSAHGTAGQRVVN